MQLSVEFNAETYQPPAGSAAPARRSMLGGANIEREKTGVKTHSDRHFDSLPHPIPSGMLYIPEKYRISRIFPMMAASNLADVAGVL